MKAIEILFPVFFMMLLGWTSRQRGWISATQNDGAKSLVFTLLFPVLVFDILARTQLSANFLYEILFLDAAWLVVYLIGKSVGRPVCGRYAHLAPFLLMTCEGGSVALPLYISLVGPEHAANIIPFDVAGILINFGFVPAIIMRQTSNNVALRPLAKRIATTPFILAVVLGLAANLLDIHSWLQQNDVATIYNGTMTAATAPIGSIILFTLGYEFRLHLSQLRPLIGLSVVRLLCCSMIAGALCLLFPEMASKEVFLVGVLLYFACPTGFPVPLQIEAICKDGDDEGFMSAFISIFILLAMIVYTLLTIGIVH